MLFKALSAAVYGIDANLIDVEVDYSGVVAEKEVFHTVGLPDAAVRESRDRVRAAIKNSGYGIPPTFITINLAPADMKKEGAGFDLPIAVGILGAYGALKVDDLSQFLLVGELGLDGGVRAVPGMLPVAILAREKGIPNLILPTANAAEAAVVEGVNVYPVSSLLDVLDLLNSAVVGVIQREPYRVSTEKLLGELQHFSVDFKGGSIFQVKAPTASITQVEKAVSDGGGGTATFYLDSMTSTPIASVTLPVTGGWQTWTTTNAPVTGASGVHTLYVVFAGVGSSTSIANVNWFQFQ